MAVSVAVSVAVCVAGKPHEAECSAGAHHSEVVVLAHSDEGQLPQGGHVHSLVELQPHRKHSPRTGLAAASTAPHRRTVVPGREGRTWPWFAAPSPYMAMEQPPLLRYFWAKARPAPTGICTMGGVSLSLRWSQ